MALFAAVIACLSQIAIPMPSGVPITLQTFAVALTGMVLGWKRATISTVVYVLLGAVGVPVFAGFSGGFGIIIGMTGGFIIGFIAMALLCGIKPEHKVLGIVFGIAGLLVCHILGAVWFSVVSQTGIIASFLAVSVPYLIKDVISVVAAFLVAFPIRKGLEAVERRSVAA